MPLPPQLEKGWLRRLIDFYSSFGPAQLAAAVAYRAVLGLFPTILAFLAALDYLAPARPLSPHVLAGLEPFLPASSLGMVSQLVDALRLPAGWGGLLGFSGLLWTGTALVDSLAQAFNRAYGVRCRPFFRQKHLSLTVLLLMGLWLTLWGDLHGRLQVARGSTYGTVAFLFLLFLVLYRLLPNLELPWRQVWPGAAFATLGVGLSGQAFKIYLIAVGIDRYKIFGLLFLFLLWFYLLAHILILGAGLNAFLRQGGRAAPVAHPLVGGRPTLEVLRGGKPEEGRTRADHS